MEVEERGGDGSYFLKVSVYYINARFQSSKSSLEILDQLSAVID